MLVSNEPDYLFGMGDCTDRFYFDFADLPDLVTLTYEISVNLEGVQQTKCKFEEKRKIYWIISGSSLLRGRYSERKGMMNATSDSHYHSPNPLLGMQTSGMQFGRGCK
ncbi:hypothetical protein CQ011_15070 [Arthrobacter sp. MYb213]|nr:hypothetical protein CQ011_15070 [Arthrobacter sp. MYb213]